MCSVIINSSSISKTLYRAERSNFILNNSDWYKGIVISEDVTLWNNGQSNNPYIVIANDNIVYVVWEENTDGVWGADSDILIVNYTTATGWSNVTVVSDIYGWNTGISSYPNMAIDNGGNLHVVWYDYTSGEWGGGSTDEEIMYANYTTLGWSNATVISDDNTGWNNNESMNPSIAIDNSGNIHVVWYDDTDGIWGIEYEIFYVNYTIANGWSNATCISDVYGWNDDDSYRPSIAVDDNSVVHVVWHDTTDGEWGVDIEIMYTNYTSGVWSNATVISDDDTGWNSGSSYCPNIAIDNNSVVHVVWHDVTDGEWGADTEIMYTNYTGGTWSNATVISDDSTGFNDDTSWYPHIVADKSGVLHVVWNDKTDGPWGMDDEIMYTTYNTTSTAGWTKPIVMSDNNNNWNNDESDFPCIAIDNNSIAHIVWQDDTDGWWGADREIMYSNNSFTSVSGGAPKNPFPLLLLIYSELASAALGVGIGIGIGVLITTVVVGVIVIIKIRQES